MNIFRKLKKKLNNSGSSIILVVVALGFIGILTGALLTAAAYAYRQKLYNYNSKDNFYYLEQSMNEIYAGVGIQTMDSLKQAYDETVNYIVYYNPSTSAYVSRSNDEANKKFKTLFMEKVAASAFFNSSSDVIADNLASLISNDSVTIDKNRIHVTYWTINAAGNEVEITKAEAASNVVSKIVIEDVVLSRTSEYKRSQASGSFTQTISTDIEVSQPDFDVNFTSTALDMSTAFEYAIIADNGVEITQGTDTSLAVKGNIYAAADYYNKWFSTEYGNSKEVTLADGKKRTIAKTIANDSIFANYDGTTDKTAYSGLYISNSNVAFLSDLLVIPGSIAVMDNSSVSIYSKDGVQIGDSEVWCDDFVLGGDSVKTGDSYAGPTAMLRANMHVKDDLELNANGSSFSLVGTYDGYGNSSTIDDRKFVSSVSIDLYQDSTKARKGHFNSSAIAINGLKSTLDLSSVKTLNVAGRTYIEHSKTESTSSTGLKSYYFSSTIDDYKTGESVSIRPDQLAYVPCNYGAKYYLVDFNADGLYNPEFGDFFIVDVAAPLAESNLIKNHFGTIKYKTGNMNAISTAYMQPTHYTLYSYDPSAKWTDAAGKQIIGKSTGAYNGEIGCGVPILIKNIATQQGKDTKSFFYYDFGRAYLQYRLNNQVTSTSTTAYNVNNINSEDDLRTHFITSYIDLLNTNTTDAEIIKIQEILTDIRNFTGYEDESVLIPVDDTETYKTAAAYGSTSGAIAVNDSGTSFRMITGNDDFDYTKLISGKITSDATLDVSNYAQAMVKQDQYLKYSLRRLDTDVDKAICDNVDALVADADYTEAAITPINTYFNFEKLTKNANINLNGYVIQVFDGSTNVLIKDDLDGKNDGKVSGIILSKGAVNFDSGVTDFEGMIVTGDKVIIGGANSFTSVSANAEMCREIMRELQFSKDANAKYIMKLFKEYDSLSTIDLNSCTAAELLTINNFDDSDDDIITQEQADEIISVRTSYASGAFSSLDEVQALIDEGKFTKLTQAAFDAIKPYINTNQSVEVQDIAYVEYSSVVKYNNWMKDVTENYGE